MSTALVNIGAYRGRFFEVLQETERTQTAVMTIAPGRDGGPDETHAGDQVVFVVEGEAVVTIEGEATPGGALHHVRNPGSEPLFFLTVYAPPVY